MRSVCSRVLCVAVTIMALGPVSEPRVAALSPVASDKSDDDAAQDDRRRSLEAAAHEAAPTGGTDEGISVASAAVQGLDTTGDTSPVYDCHGDITSYAGSYSLDEIGLWFSTICGSDPFNGANWVTGISHIIWSIDVNGD